MTRLIAVALLLAGCAFAQTATDPFPKPIAATEDVVRVDVTEFASLPSLDGQAARPMLLVDEPGTRRLFVNEMRGVLYSVSYDGKNVTQYLDLRNVRLQLMHPEQGFQTFAFHPQFNESGTPGFGKFYTLVDTSNTEPTPDFTPSGGDKSHHMVLLEWTARNPKAGTYDGEPPRELIRWEQPFRNHNGGQIAFNPRASRGDTDFGLLYIGMADGGSGGDPLNHAQNLNSAFGKILRINPLGSDSKNGKYGIHADNPFVKDGNDKTLGEIYALGVRNPQRFSWDPKNGNMFLAEIGQNIVEEVSLITAGANLGWNKWEGSFGFISRTEISQDNQRGDSKVTYPIVEYGHIDPLLLRSNSAVTGIYVYRQSTIPQLTNLLLFGDNPSGEVFYIHADKLPNGGQDAIRRVLFNSNGGSKEPATRADLRFGLGPDNRIFLLNKHDGVIRLLVPTRGPQKTN